MRGSPTGYACEGGDAIPCNWTGVKKHWAMKPIPLQVDRSKKFSALYTIYQFVTAAKKA